MHKHTEAIVNIQLNMKYLTRASKDKQLTNRIYAEPSQKNNFFKKLYTMKHVFNLIHTVNNISLCFLLLLQNPLRNQTPCFPCVVATVCDWWNKSKFNLSTSFLSFSFDAAFCCFFALLSSFLLSSSACNTKSLCLTKLRKGNLNNFETSKRFTKLSTYLSFHTCDQILCVHIRFVEKKL